MARMTSIFQWIGRIAGVTALLLGMLFWFTPIDLTSVHIVLGIAVAVALLALSVIAVGTSEARPLGAAGIVYALILPLFGLTQARLLVTNLHWIIQLAHLLVGLGALALIQVIGTRLMRPDALPRVAGRVA